MAEKILNTRLQMRYDSLTNWNTENPILKKGEIAIAYLGDTVSDKLKGENRPVLMKVGDGSTEFKLLPYASALAADVYDWAKKSEDEFKAWVKTLVDVSDIDTYSKGEIDSKFTANSAADLAAAKSYVDELVAGLDADVSHTAGADGLALTLTQVDGKVTGISGSIAANTYDAHGAAAAAEAAAKSHADTKASQAQAAAEQTAASALSTARTEITQEIATAKSGAETTAANALSAARTEIDAAVKVAKDRADEAYNLADSKVDAGTYATDKKALQDEDAAVRAIAEDAQTKIDTFMGTVESSTEIVDTLQEVIALINSEDAELSTTLMSEINTLKSDKADKTDVESVSNRVKAIEEAPYVTKSQLDDVDNKFASYTNTEALTALLAGKETAGAAEQAKQDAIADAAGKYETKGTAQGLVDALANGAVATNTSGISSINALLETYGDIVTHNVAEFATKDQGAKADSALQEITTTANGGLKVTNKNQIDIDTAVTFVFNCGDAAGNPLQ